jgi:hypothetical protein
VALTGEQESALGAFDCELSSIDGTAAGDTLQVEVDQEHYYDYQGTSLQGTVTRNGPSAHAKNVTASTIGISETPSGQLYVGGGDTHGVEFGSQMMM